MAPNAIVEVLSVVEPLYTRDFPTLIETLKQRADERVQAAAQQLRSSGMESTALVLCGREKGVIVDYARQTGADLILVGSHKVTTVGHFLRGSVARAVVRFAPCSVEVVRAGAGAGGMKTCWLPTDPGTRTLQRGQ